MFQFPRNAVILFFKATQLGLFEDIVPIKGHMRNGHFINPTMGKRRKANKKPPSGDLFSHLLADTHTEHKPAPEVKKPRKPRKPRKPTPEQLAKIQAKVNQMLAHAKVDAQHAPSGGQAHRKIYLAMLDAMKGIPEDVLEKAKQDIEGLFKPKVEKNEPEDQAYRAQLLNVQRKYPDLPLPMQEHRARLLERARKYDEAKAAKNTGPSERWEVKDVTPQGYGPEPSSGDSWSPHAEQLTTDQKNLHASINEAKTILRGKISGDKRKSVEASLKKTEEKLAKETLKEKIRAKEKPEPKESAPAPAPAAKQIQNDAPAAEGNTEPTTVTEAQKLLEGMAEKGSLVMRAIQSATGGWMRVFGVKKGGVVYTKPSVFHPEGAMDMDSSWAPVTKNDVSAYIGYVKNNRKGPSFEAGKGLLFLAKNMDKIIASGQEAYAKKQAGVAAYEDSMKKRDEAKEISPSSLEVGDVFIDHLGERWRAVSTDGKTPEFVKEDGSSLSPVTFGKLKGTLEKRTGNKADLSAQEPKKEPWQVTKNDFGWGGENDWPLQISSKGKVYGDMAREAWAAENSGHRGAVGYYRTPEAAQNWVDKTHKRLVKQALADGKPVPPEVLADYPELKQKGDNGAISINRVNPNGTENLVFNRGEEVKVAGSYPMKTGRITGISHAKKTVTVDGVEYGHGYIYKKNYDEFSEPKAEMERQLSDIERRLNGNTSGAEALLDKAKEHAARFNLPGYQSRIDALSLKLQSLRAEMQRQQEAANEPKPPAAAPPGKRPIRMTMEEWKKTHKDFKSNKNGERMVMRGGALHKVEIIKPDKAPTALTKKAAAIVEKSRLAIGRIKENAQRAKETGRFSGARKKDMESDMAMLQAYANKLGLQIRKTSVYFNEKEYDDIAKEIEAQLLARDNEGSITKSFRRPRRILFLKAG